MSRTLLAFFASALLCSTVYAHCQVPCGIYGARWVVTKETHAGAIQSTIADYFLAQRIKSDSPSYADQLKAAHAVTVAAMKCKQSTDGATAAALETAIHDLYRAYEGKEPDLH